MKRLLLGTLALALVGALAACSDSTSPEVEFATCDGSQPSDLFPPLGAGQPQASLRFINAAPQYGGVNLCIDSWEGWTNQPNSLGSRLDMKASSIPHTLVVTTIGDEVVLASTKVTFKVDTQYIAVFAQRGTDSRLIVLDTVPVPPSGQIFLRLVNTRPDVGAVDVYKTTGSTDLTGLTPVVSNLSFGAVSPYISYTPDPTSIIVTAAGDPSTVLHTSGPFTDAVGQVWTGLLMYAHGGIPWILDRS